MRYFKKYVTITSCNIKDLQDICWYKLQLGDIIQVIYIDNENSNNRS